MTEPYSVALVLTPALDKLLTHHARTCAFWIFSGDRHCSCGLDAAVKELEQLKDARINEQYSLFVAPHNRKLHER